MKEKICPICFNKTTKKNPLVIYHIKYKPPLVILACKYCNYTEFLIRNNIKIISKNINKKRIFKVINYQKKFNINI